MPIIKSWTHFPLIFHQLFLKPKFWSTMFFRMCGSPVTAVFTRELCIKRAFSENPFTLQRLINDSSLSGPPSMMHLCTANGIKWAAVTAVGTRDNDEVFIWANFPLSLSHPRIYVLLGPTIWKTQQEQPVLCSFVLRRMFNIALFSNVPRCD